MKQLEIYHNWNAKALELFELMKTTQQSPVHHKEGFVYLHTQMVLDEVEKITGNAALLYTALLHDIAKPVTTVFEDGDWRSPSHAKVGEAIAREILWNDFSFEERENICALIRFHGLPIWFDQKENVEQYIIGASLRCNLKELADFAVCDFRGRICDDLEESLFKIELFREKCEELDCYGNPYPFLSDWSRLSFFKKSTHQTAPIWKPQGSNFIVMCGMPASGKNTWVEKNWGGKVVEMDSIRKRLKVKLDDKNAQGLIHQTAKEELRESLRKKEDVLWNATNISQLQRSTIIDLSLNYDANIKIVYIDCPIEKALAKNKEREEKKMMPEKVLWKMFRKLEVPTLAECHSLEIIKV